MSIKIGYQGVAGAYSQAALEKFTKAMSWTPADMIEENFDDFGTLVEALLEERLDYAVIPIENSTTGLITRSLDLFRGVPIIGTAEVYQEVRHVLWGLEGATLDDIKEVYSHPEALSQCERFFKNHPAIRPVSYVDTAKAAKLVKDMGDKTIAAIASPQAGEIYGLKSILGYLQTEKINTTRFVLASKLKSEAVLKDLMATDPSRTRTIFFIKLPHKKGSLARLLNLFSVFDINLEALNSRPIEDQPFSYGFFIEVDLSNTGIDLDALWTGLTYVCDKIQIVANLTPENFG